MSIAQNWLAGISAGRQHRMQDEAIAKQNRLGQLAGQAFGAAPEQRGSILSQVAEVDPESAFAMQERFAREDQSAEQAKHARLTNMAKMLAAAPEPMRGGLYSQMVPSLRGMGLNAPDAWDDSLMGVVQSLAGTGGEEFRPMVVAPGSALVDPRRGVLFQNPAKAERFPIVNVPDGNGGTIAMRDTPQGLMPLSAGLGAPAAPSAPALPYRVNIQGLQPESVQQARAMIEQDIGRPLNDAEWAQVTGRNSGAAPSPRASGFGTNPARPQPRLATPDEKRLYGYGENDIVEIDANGLPKPIRVAEAPGAKAPSADTANKVSLYDNALRAANEWRSLVVSSDGSFNDIAARTPQARALLDQALRAKLRAESGASISSEEIAGETGRYMGGLFSSDATAAQQANALIEDLTNQRAALDPSGQIQPVIPVGGSQQPSSPPPAAGGIRIISVTPAGQR